jgi:hypothetical protein
MRHLDRGLRCRESLPDELLVDLQQAGIRVLRVIVSAIIALAPLVAMAADAPEYKLTIRDHKFSPPELVIPANTRIKLTVDNQDATAEEFESHELDREKIVTGNASVSLSIGPLKPGRYPFFGDFHQDTAQGVVVAK